MRLLVREMKLRRRIARGHGEIYFLHLRGQATSCGSEADQERIRAQKDGIWSDIGMNEIPGMQKLERRYQWLHMRIYFFLGGGLL